MAEYPDGRIIMVLPDDPKYALKKVWQKELGLHILLCLIFWYE